MDSGNIQGVTLIRAVLLKISRSEPQTTTKMLCNIDEKIYGSKIVEDSAKRSLLKIFIF